MNYFPIGELSKLSQVKVPTIRYYESIGLLPEPIRTSGNRRVYTEDSLRRLNFIRRARELGFDGQAIRQLQDLLEDPSQPCENAHSIAEHRLQEIEEKLTQLQELKSRLLDMTSCGNHTNIESCTIMERLDHDNKPIPSTK
jgi:DNA-binding transcriptional MerR regulator